MKEDQPVIIIMSVLDKLPITFWEEIQTDYKKYKKGGISLDECFERQRELSLLQIEKIKKEQEMKFEKNKRAEAIFEKIKARSLEKVKKKEREANNLQSDNDSNTKKDSVPDAKVDVKAEESKSNQNQSKPSATYNCEECEKNGKSFNSNVLKLYENHIHMKHSNYKPFKCEQDKCGYTTHKKGNLNKHLTIHKEWTLELEL